MRGIGCWLTARLCGGLLAHRPAVRRVAGSPPGCAAGCWLTRPAS